MSKDSTTKETFILVMPSYNEGGRIAKTLTSWSRVVKTIPGSEILIVDGNSSDDTAEIVKKFIKKYKFIKLIQKKREGYGKDLIHGYKLALKSGHKWIFQTDTDSPFNASDFYKLWDKRHSSPLILGKRHKRKDAFFRLVLALIIQITIVILFRKLIVDSNIPFRLIKADYLMKVLGKIPSSTIAPNIFLSIMASKGGHELHHIPVKSFYRDNNKNTSRILSGAFKGIFDIIGFAQKKFN